MIRQLHVHNSSETAPIHYNGMPHEFLPQFGIPFLEILHRAAICDIDSITLGFEEKKSLAGFIIVTNNTRRFIKKTIFLYFWRLAPIVGYRIIKNPTVLKYIVETLFYSKNDDDNPEVLVLSVAKQYRRMGIASALLQSSKKILYKKGYSTFTVGTLANNLPANALYKRFGIHTASYYVYGKQWNHYTITTK